MGSGDCGLPPRDAGLPGGLCIAEVSASRSSANLREATWSDPGGGWRWGFVQAAYLNTVSACCCYFQLVWLGNRALSKAGTEHWTVLWRCVVVGAWESGIALSHEGRGRIPLGVSQGACRAAASIGSEVVGGRIFPCPGSCWDHQEGENWGVGEDLVLFPLLSERNVMKWKRLGKVGQIVSEEGLGLLLCPGFHG